MMRKEKAWLLAILFLVLSVGVWTKAQTHTAALVNQANVFTQPNTFLNGISLPGSNSGTLTLTTPSSSPGASYTLPGLPGSPGYALCIGSTPGSLAYCPPPGGGAGTQTVNQVPTALNFGSVASTTPSAPQVVLVGNTGTAVLTFTGSPITLTGTNAANFSETNNCSGTLDAGWVCQITVIFTPSEVGPKTATLNIYNNAASSPQTVSLSGTGI